MRGAHAAASRGAHHQRRRGRVAGYSTLPQSRRWEPPAMMFALGMSHSAATCLSPPIKHPASSAPPPRGERCRWAGARARATPKPFPPGRVNDADADADARATRLSARRPRACERRRPSVLHTPVPRVYPARFAICDSKTVTLPLLGSNSTIFARWIFISSPPQERYGGGRASTNEEGGSRAGAAPSHVT